MLLRYFREKRLRQERARLTCGTNVFIDRSVQIYGPENVKIGNDVHIQFGCSFFVSAKDGLTIGDGCVFAHDVQILTRNHNYDSDDLEYIPYDKRQIDRPVEIGEYSWIGARVTILPGVKIGRGVVVGAGSVVTKNVPDYAVVGGNPAKILKYRNKEKFEELLKDGKGYIKCTKNYR